MTSQNRLVVVMTSTSYVHGDVNENFCPGCEEVERGPAQVTLRRLFH